MQKIQNNAELSIMKIVEDYLFNETKYTQKWKQTQKQK